MYKDEKWYGARLDSKTSVSATAEKIRIRWNSGEYGHIESFRIRKPGAEPVGHFKAKIEGYLGQIREAKERLRQRKIENNRQHQERMNRAYELQQIDEKKRLRDKAKKTTSSAYAIACMFLAGAIVCIKVIAFDGFGSTLLCAAIAFAVCQCLMVWTWGARSENMVIHILMVAAGLATFIAGPFVVDIIVNAVP